MYVTRAGIDIVMYNIIFRSSQSEKSAKHGKIANMRLKMMIFLSLTNFVIFTMKNIDISIFMYSPVSNKYMEFSSHQVRYIASLL